MGSHSSTPGKCTPVPLCKCDFCPCRVLLIRFLSGKSENGNNRFAQVRHQTFGELQANLSEDAVIQPQQKLKFDPQPACYFSKVPAVGPPTPLLLRSSSTT